MFLAGSIGVVVEEMWRLAVAMASLKYIAQVVGQEVQRDVIDTDSEIILEDDYEDISLGNGLDANEDITEGLDTNKDITKGLDANKDITKGLDATEDIENKEQDIQSLISMKSHVLDSADTPTSHLTAQLSISMISHCQPCKYDDQDGQYESDPHLMTSMVAHCLYGTETPPELYLSINMKTLHMLKKTTTTNKENKFFSSSVAHQLPMIDCPLESCAYKISMVSHEVMENNKNEDDNIIETDSVSMLAHQICNEAALQPEDIETPKTLVRIPNNIVSIKHESDQMVSTSGLANKPNIENILNEQVVCDEQITSYVQTGLSNMQENIVEDDTSNLSAALLEEADGSRMCDLNLSKQWLFKPKFGSYKNFLVAARISHQITLERVYLCRIKRIKEIQENVEYEIDEYKRRKNMLAKDENGSVKEYKLLTNVKGIEFDLHILIHQSDAHNEDIENSVSNNLAASEHKDNKQMCDKSENNLKKTIKYDPNIEHIEHIEHGNELDKSQLLHDLGVSKDSLEEYKEHILKVKTCTFAPGNDINLAIEQLLQLASTMENTLKYIVGMIYTDYEQENTSDLSEPEEEKQHSSNLTSDPLDINQMEDNILDEDKSSNKHEKQIDIVSIVYEDEQQQWVEDALNTSLKPLTNTDKTFIKSEKGSTHSLLVDEDCNCVDKEITDEYIHIDQQDELVTAEVAGDVTDLEPIETASDASFPNYPHCYDEADQSFITSFVGHQVIAIDLPEVFVQMPFTMASHMIAKITEEEEKRSSEMDPGMRTSMVTHQIVVKDNTKTVSDEDLLKDKENIHDLNPTKRIKVRAGFARQLERHYLRMQDNVLRAFSTSMVSHQLPYIETGLSRFSVSATAHRVMSCAEENSESHSMVTYQIRTDNRHINSLEQETNTLQLNNEESQPNFHASPASHQLPLHEVIEYPEFITSMTAHQDIKMGKDIENTNAEVSMHTHALVQDNSITDTGLDNSEQTIHETEKGEGKIESLNTDDENATLMNKTMQDKIMNKVHSPDSTDGSKEEIDDNNLIKVIKTSKTKEKSVTKLKIQARGTIESKSGNKNEQTYKVRFRVKLTSQDGSSSKSSVLQYLRGCLTGQSLFQAKQ